jgi:ATP-dependent DNA ligase
MELEGIVSKRRDLSYRSARVSKIKCVQAQQFVVAG